MFRFRRSVPVSYDRQGLIYFYSRLYRSLPEKKQARIRRLCQEAGGEYAEALFDFVVGNLNAPAVCGKYFLSQSTLDRVVRKYYMMFPKNL